MQKYEGQGEGYKLRVKIDKKTTQEIALFVTPDAHATLRKKPVTPNLFLKEFPDAPTSPRLTQAMQLQPASKPFTPPIEFVSTTSQQGQQAEQPSRKETEIVDPVERLAKQLYGEWKVMIASELAKGDPHFAQINATAINAVTLAARGDTTARGVVKGEMDEFIKREKHALSEGYPPTKGLRAFGKGFGETIRKAPQPWAPFLGSAIERLSHRDEQGNIINDRTSLQGDLHKAASSLTSSLLGRFFEQPEAHRLHPNVKKIAQQAHDAAHESIRQRQQDKMLYTTLVTYQVGEQMGQPGETTVLSVFKQLAEMQLSLERDLLNANPKVLKILEGLGKVAAVGLVVGGALLGEKAAEKATHLGQQGRLPEATRRLLPPPSAKN